MDVNGVRNAVSLSAIRIEKRVAPGVGGLAAISVGSYGNREPSAAISPDLPSRPKSRIRMGPIFPGPPSPGVFAHGVRNIVSLAAIRIINIATQGVYELAAIFGMVAQKSWESPAVPHVRHPYPNLG